MGRLFRTVDRYRVPFVVLSVIGIVGLLGAEAARRLTSEPAPWIRVRWQDDVSIERQAALERRYRLVSRTAPATDAPRSFAYLLLDTRRSNIEALVRDPAVADTNDVDRDAFRIGPSAERAGTMWLADRIPVLRDERARRLGSGALVVMALAGVPVLFVAGLRTIRRIMAAAHVRRGARGLARWLAEPPARRARTLPLDRAALAWKLAAAGLIATIIGVPILAAWEALVLATTFIVVVVSTRHLRRGRLGMAVVVVLAVVSVKAFLPRADIAEAHNAFLVLGPGGALERGLPPPVFRSWKAQFDALYRPDAAANPPPSEWRANPEINTPAALYTQSADAIWRRPRYTRQVDAIAFLSLAEFRGGFANESELRGERHANRYNFWTGDVVRASMPFYAMYELSPASVGSRLRWKGQVFWERGDGGFDEIVHPRVASRRIEAGDAGKRVYAAFFPARDSELHFALEPALSLRAAALIRAAVIMLGALVVLGLLIRPRWPSCGSALALFAGGFVAVGLHDSLFGGLYWPHGGGNDGLVHDGWGRMMAMLAGEGDIREALRGAESVYWFTPGTRYFRMVEKLVFGDTNHLYALLLACTPVVLFALLAHFVRRGVALAVAMLFLVVPVGSLTFLQYIAWAKVGFGEPLAVGFFLLAAVLLVQTEPRWGGDYRSHARVVVGGAALAASMFIRPNFTIAAVWLGTAYAWMSLRGRDPVRTLALACGLGLALWMPFHNWYYGGELYLISKSGGALTLPLGVRDYVAAALDLVRGDLGAPAVDVIARQLKGWLGGPVFVGGEPQWLAGPAHLLNLLSLAVCAWVAVTSWRGGAERSALAVLAVASLCAHLPMLFIFDTSNRYAMLAWDLGLIVLIIWIAERMTLPARAHKRPVPVAVASEAP